MSSPRVLAQPTMSRSGTSFTKGSDIRSQASFRRQPSSASMSGSAAAPSPAQGELRKEASPAVAPAAADDKRKRIVKGSHVQKGFFSCCGGTDDVDEAKPKDKDKDENPLAPAGASAKTKAPGKPPKPSPLQMVASDLSDDDQAARNVPAGSPMTKRRDSAQQGLEKADSSAWGKEPGQLTRKSSIIAGKPPTPRTPLGRAGSFGPNKPPTAKAAGNDEPAPLRRLSSKSTLQQSQGLGRKSSFSTSASPVGSPSQLPGSVGGDDEPPASSSLVRRSSSFVMPSASGAPPSPAGPRPPLSSRPPSASGKFTKGKNSTIVSGAAMPAADSPDFSASASIGSPLRASGSRGRLPPRSKPAS